MLPAQKSTLQPDAFKKGAEFQGEGSEKTGTTTEDMEEASRRGD